MRMKKEDFIRGLAILHHHHHKPAESSTTNVGNKQVLPITSSETTATRPSSTVTVSSNDQCGSTTLEKEKRPKRGDKARAIASMKGLVKRAVAAAKSEKGGKHINWKVLHFRNRGKVVLKEIPDDEELSIDSPKISLRWDVESCSTTTSSVYSAFSMASSTKNDHSLSALIHETCFKCTKTGSWITTDSEFLVLEL